jgi:Probable cobalt transporter subunit (CbtA)
MAKGRRNSCQHHSGLIDRIAVGIVFAYTHSSVPGSNNKKKALIVASIMWFVLFLMPALKYPANPPAVGDPETIYYRQSESVCCIFGDIGI